MNRQLFTDKQIANLLLNPNVFSVTKSTLMLTKSFKERFYAEYIKGALPRDILERHGFFSRHHRAEKNLEHYPAHQR